MTGFAASRNTQLAKKGEHRLRDDHPLGARYQISAVEIFASQPNRQFLLRTAMLAAQWYAFNGKPLPGGSKAATLARYDGDAVQNAFGTLYCIMLITFCVRIVDIPKLNAMSDSDLLALWDEKAADGWPIRRGPTVRGDEHLNALEVHWKAATPATGEDAIPIPEELARKQLIDEQMALMEQEDLEEEKLEAERREAEQRGASNGRAA